MTMNSCPYCARPLRRGSLAVGRHVSQSPRCRAAQLAALNVVRVRLGNSPRKGANEDARPEGDNRQNFPVTLEDADEDDAGIDVEMEMATHEVIEEQNAPPAPPPPQRPRPSPNEVYDFDPNVTYGRKHPNQAGAPIHGERKTTRFARLAKRYKMDDSKGNFGPFKSEKEWKFSRVLTKHLGKGQTDELLDTELLKETGLSYHNARKLYQKVDALPKGPEWIREILEVDCGFYPDGSPRKEEVELWRRDPNECIAELIGDPTFNGHLAYGPERVFVDDDGEVRCFSEMWTGNWWWEVQNKLPPGATVAPVIISTDATQLSKFRGDKKAWPVYLSIGNISKDIRRKPSLRATTLIGYIPAEGLDGIDDSSDRSAANWQLFHDCMRRIMHPLKSSGTTGLPMLCADGFTRQVYPILAAYVADYPEQCLVGCVKGNRCPKCPVDKDELEDNGFHHLRDSDRTWRILFRKAQPDNPITTAFEEDGLRPIKEPFWHDLPHSNIHAAFTPDILHQLHKGVFYDHLMSWLMSLVGDEVDARFKTVPLYPALRHFKKGLSMLSQCSGNEFKEMQKCILGVIANSAESEVVEATRAVLEFLYYAQFQFHTDRSLDAMQAALDDFHSHKDVFVRLEIREHFNIPKVHSMQHYIESIRLMGTADGYNTELPERLHIDYAKNAYRASNKRDYLKQMTTWLTRQESLFLFAKLADWAKGQTAEIIAEDSVPDEEEAEDNEALASYAPRRTEERRRPFNSGPGTSSSSYALPKHPSFPHRSIMELESADGHKAFQFRRCLTDYLAVHVPFFRWKITMHDRLPVYKQARVLLQDIPQVSAIKRLNTIRAIPEKKSKPGEPGIPERFDPVLVRCDIPSDSYVGTALEGLRVARVKAIFSLPVHISTGEERLAYIEWFRPLRAVDATTQLHSITYARRGGGISAEIISLSDIIQSVHLIPKFGAEMDPAWNRFNIFDKCDTFFVNSWINLHTYHLFRNNL